MKLPAIWRSKATHEVTKNTDLDDRIAAFEKEIGDTISFRKNDDGSTTVECDNTFVMYWVGGGGQYAFTRTVHANAKSSSDEEAFDSLVHNFRENKIWRLVNPETINRPSDYDVGYFSRPDLGVGVEREYIRTFDELKERVYSPSSYARKAISVVGGLFAPLSKSMPRIGYDR